MRILALALALVTLGSCHASNDAEPEIRPQVSESAPRRHLPTICRPYYNDGTGRWAECMRVGPK